MNKIFGRQVMLFEKPIDIRVSIVDEGILVQISGGDKSHIGAVAVIDPLGEKHVLEFPGHRDRIIAETWAGTIYEKTRMPVVVSAGVHYDQITKDQIQMILKTLDQILYELEILFR